jgi:threonine dehydratase
MNAPVSGSDFGAIEQARKTIANKVLLHTCSCHAGLSDQLGVPVHLKLEHTQITGSFKLRGATNAVASLSAGGEAARRGRRLDRKSWPRPGPRREGSRGAVHHLHVAAGPQAKIDGIKAQGAEVRIVGAHRTRRSWRSTGWWTKTG